MNQTLFLIICFIFLINTTLAQRKTGETSANQETQQKQKTGKTRADLKENLKITESEKLEYKEILNNSDVKIAKIWNSPCKFKNVIDATDTFCLEQFDLRFASNYAFQGATTYASIILAKGEFWSPSFRSSYALLVDIGEVDLSQIGKETKEVLILNNFPLIDYLQSIKKQTLSQGFEFQGLKISDKQPAKLNHVYLLKTVNYNEREFLTEGSEITLSQKRETIYAFQIIKEKGGIATILWKNIKAK